MREFERVMLLSAVDNRWMDHIDAMDQLRDGIGYRAYAQKDPVVEYKIESGHMFDELIHFIREDTVRRIYQARVERTPERVQQAKPWRRTWRVTNPGNPAKYPPPRRWAATSPAPVAAARSTRTAADGMTRKGEGTQAARRRSREAATNER